MIPYQEMSFWNLQKDIVLDPFMGSGQTAIAAIKSGRYFVGYEINKDYVKLTKKRIKEYLIKINSPTLFDYIKEVKHKS